MRAAILLIALNAAHAGVVSRDWSNAKLSLQLDRGVAEIEWLSPTAFRYARGTASPPVLTKIKHGQVYPDFEDTRTTLAMRGKYITIEIDKATANLKVLANGATVSSLAYDGQTMQIAGLSRTFGLSGPGDTRRFFFTTGYGMFVRAPNDCTFDLERGNIAMAGAFDLLFYFGPTPKEVFEQHQLVTGALESTPQGFRLPPIAAPLPQIPLDSWESLQQLLHTLNQWSLSGVLYPALDLHMLDARGELGKRGADLATILPIVYGDKNLINIAERDSWMPYLVTYFREAFDKGYPLIRPFPVEFSRDSLLDPQPDVFMLGDEVLLAPKVEPGPRRTLRLPRGTWTDVRTDAIYKGNQSVEVEAPTGFVPTFARNGAILPIAAKRAMELHYYPDLGGEFFLWEADKQANSQFHAAPAGEAIRVEIESKVPRTYEWVLHHVNRPANIKDYTPVRQRSALKPGNWWHDELRNDLHLMVRVEPGTDNIVIIDVR